MKNMQEELRKAIIENPNLEIKMFVGEDCNCGDYSYQIGEISHVEVDKITYNDDKFYNTDDMQDHLYDILYCGQSEKELNEEVDKTMKQIKWETAICVYIG